MPSDAPITETPNLLAPSIEGGSSKQTKQWHLDFQRRIVEWKEGRAPEPSAADFRKAIDSLRQHRQDYIAPAPKAKAAKKSTAKRKAAQADPDSIL